MKKHIASTLFLSLLSILQLTAQSHSVKKLGIEQGLSNNYVVSITQDKQGFLWFATEEGLNKFDGTRFITYYKNDLPHNNQGITGNELNRVYADSKRPIIWIATQRDGLNAYNYDEQTFTAYQHNPENPHSLITNDVTDISPSTQNDDGLWVSTYYRGIEYLNINNEQFTHYNRSTVPSLPSNQTWTVLDGGDNNLYIGHVGSGFSIFSLKDKSVKNFQNETGNPTSLPGNDVFCIIKDANGNIWLGTNNGLALYNAANDNFITFRNNKNDKYATLCSRILSIRQLKDNRLWIASELNGIAILNLKQGMFLSPEELSIEYIQEGDDSRSLSNASARCIFQDSFDNIWIGTWGGGINFISSKPPLFTTLSYSPIPNNENSLNNKVASSLCMDRQGRIWIGTDGGGINVFEGEKRIAIYKKESGDIPSNFILASLQDSKGNLWFGSYQGGISYYDSRNKRFRSISLMGQSNLDVRTIYEDAQHNIWVGYSGGIVVLNPLTMKIIQHYNTDNSELHSDFIRSIAQDEKGRFWIGTFGDGLGIYTPNLQKIKTFTQRDGFCSNTINQIIQDKQKRMWIGTGEGLVCFLSTDELNYKTYQRKDGLINTNICAITEDKKGNIWFSNNKGISCYVTNKGCFYNYDHSDDVPAGSFSSSCVTQSKNGQIYFGSINGVCCFNPDITMNEQPAPAAVVTEMKILGRLSNLENNDMIINLSKGQNVELSHAQNSFGLTFNVQNYSLVNQVEYVYMLKGLENSWYTVNENNSVTFRNIPPGKYEFLIKARIHNQKWPEEATSLTIRINPPLWLTWWAKLIYILVSISITYLILHAYKKKLDLESLYTLEKKNHEQEQELNQERLRFYTNITHELRTPLTLILGPLEDMQKEASLPAKQAQKLSVIHQSALRLLNLINQILEFRKTETQNKKLCVSKGNIAPLIYEIGLKYKELNQNTKIDFRIQIEKEEMFLFFDKEIITIVLDNLISNAIKYTEQGCVTLSLHQTMRNEVAYTEIKVSDTGYGISAEALPHIFDRYYQESGKHQASGTGIGLALVKNLVTLHEGEIRAESIQNEGSTFYISLLTDNIYPNALHADSTEPVQEEMNQNTELEYSQEATLDTSKPILLIVEDNEEIQKYIVESFTDSFEVITANNGEEGKQQALSRIPDIVVSDIMMPVMDGITLCKQLKDDVRTSHIPIILLTAKDSLQDKEEGYEVGADSYLTKPFSASLLRSRINNLLDSRKKLVAQFQAQSTPGSQIDLSEKRIVIAEALSKLDNEFIEKITLLIEENLSSEKIDINYLSDKMCMSGSTLYRKMKALTGLSTNEYIRKVKMKNAERLLLEGKFNISEIAYKVGMNSTGYFRQCFKEEFGLSPSDYLKQIKQS
ncbi:two-component regulator propeller domain-containing protein [Bacteroides xylanisolvens]|uniref:hybrid sensor histidine kinase/response regulator transcription factor n=1 Tax=Bacteroides xylanisolvens TaxID=371601 RepID=UPI001C37AD06|nr:two-component regulator propeller domain-containing protein [Bacteroides xylanisolvens]MBV3829920.1 response regulator [Bacteroides xylanisolvens]MBV3872985.1 response regulator [Bacteroides xylanisolvens]MBV3878497.1 response regulator [Bacteroides xylanisolvens]MBV3904536.1 response regulator [Bacteroides xylanisolvens]MBV3910046.1 response regulator [Bacteroides xylanisolvens]